jgi:squalene cyclase
MMEASITKGFNWLRLAQNPDGGWGFGKGEPSDLFATALLDWSYFVRVGLHKKLGTYSQTIQFLIKMQNPDGGWPRKPGEYSAVQMNAYVLPILIHAGPGRNSPVVLNGVRWLKKQQLKNGAWGEPEYYEVRKYDGVFVKPGKPQPWISALSVTSLLEAGESASVEVKKGIKYLLSTQQADGGWSIIEGAVSETDCTSFSVSALTRYDPKLDAIKNAIHFLLNLQNADGGWGWPNVWKKEPSSIESTARKVHALLDAGINKRLSTIKRAAKFLLSAQNQDGGWGLYKKEKMSVPYVTASVLSVLVSAI